MKRTDTRTRQTLAMLLLALAGCGGLTPAQRSTGEGAQPPTQTHAVADDAARRGPAATAVSELGTTNTAKVDAPAEADDEQPTAAAEQAPEAAPEAATPAVASAREEAPPPPAVAHREHKKDGQTRHARVAAPKVRRDGLAGLSATGSPSAPGLGLVGAGRGAGGYGKGKLSMASGGAPLQQVPARPEHNTEAYAHSEEHAFHRVSDQPLSTFSIDVDTASYANVRRFLQSGQRPPAAAVRVEEMINYFSYDYPLPVGDQPFSVHTEVASAPWNPAHRLVHIGLRGREIDQADTPPRNLVFLLDVSGSMHSPDKLPLLKQGMAMLANNLRPQDRVAIAVYAGASGLVLPSTSGDDRGTILDALDQLQAGGSTNGADGIELAYRVAAAHFVRGGINRVILATDGDFNVGATSQGALVDLIERKRESGVFLTVLGFGSGNLKDSTMELLADKGNGNYAYIDSVAEARKVLVREAGSTLVTIAKDVKLQVEFNPAQVESYRLIGYENRTLAARDFNDDKKDAGEIGAGHTVTALYEVVPRGAEPGGSEVDPLRYQQRGALTRAADSDELATVKLRYKQPDGHTSRLLAHTIEDTGLGLAESSGDFRFAAAVAGFAMVLRDSPHRGQLSVPGLSELAAAARGKDPHGDRRQLLELIDRAHKLGFN